MRRYNVQLVERENLALYLSLGVNFGIEIIDGFSHGETNLLIQFLCFTLEFRIWKGIKGE